jgi:hypothetical protein
MENKYTVMWNDKKRIHLLNVFSIKKVDKGLFEVREECDQWHKKKLTKDEIFLMLEEIKTWIEN